MLLQSRAFLRRHREVAAVLITYAMFLGSILGLAWVIA